MHLLPLLPLLLLLGNFCAQGVLFGNHSLRYFTTAIHGADSSIPHFFAVVYLDDILLEWYDSHAEVLEPRAQWMKKAVGPDYWWNRSQNLWFLQYNSLFILSLIMSQTKQTEGVHTYQILEGCELTEHNTTFVFYRTAFDGKDFLYINTDTMKWTAEMPVAEAVAEARNANKTITEQFLRGLYTMCSDVRFLLPFANQTLQRKVKPIVRVTERKLLNDSMTLHCRAYGFHPRLVEMKWLKNGTETQAKLKLEEILPNQDGSYQATVSLNVTSETQDNYSCLVRHSSLEEDKIVHWERGPESPPEPGKDMGTTQQGLSIGGIIGVVLILVVLVSAVILGLVSWQKWRQETFGQRFSNT